MRRDHRLVLDAQPQMRQVRPAVIAVGLRDHQVELARAPRGRREVQPLLDAPSSEVIGEGFTRRTQVVQDATADGLGMVFKPVIVKATLLDPADEIRIGRVQRGIASTSAPLSLCLGVTAGQGAGRPALSSLTTGSGRGIRCSTRLCRRRYPLAAR